MNYKILSIFAMVVTTQATFATESKEVRTDHITSQIISAVESIQPGQPFQVALRLKIDDHWHTYYKNPGDSGLATSISWNLPEGFTTSKIQWQTPKRLPYGPLTNFGYEGTVLHVATLVAPTTLKPGSTITLKARGDWLVCEEICIPGSADHELSLPVSAELANPSQWLEEFDAFKKSQPKPLGKNHVIAGISQGTLQLLIPEANSVETVHFFPDQEGFIDNTVEPMITSSPEGLLLSVPLVTNPTEPEILSGLLLQPEGHALVDQSASAVFSSKVGGPISSDETSATPFFLAVCLGFVGGLILNLMPCVFPVLGIKVMGFVQQAGEDRNKVAIHGLTFTAGVLISFWVLAGILLALRAGGQELGWGFQLQSPGFVFALMIFLFAFGLNLSGLFEVGASAVGVGSKLTGADSWTGSFFSGVLATVVATPCAAPFLAPALGAALSLPAVASLILFTAIGLGLSAPYLILSIKPELTQKLPRPGAWMETFKQAMAFPLYGTAAYLLWVLDGQIGEGQLLRVFFSLALIGLGLWIFGRWNSPARSELARKVGIAVAGLIMIGSLAYAWPSTEKKSNLVWGTWSKSHVEELRKEGRTIYIDFTARWCATCQTNKAVVFSNKNVIQFFEDKNIVTLKADWTNQNPEITKELARFNRSAVPFNLIYRPGQNDPTILPELLTPSIVLDALK